MSPVKKVTQEKVANRLGISIATVSRALRNLPGATSGTAAQIVETARAMGYRLPATEASAARKGTGRQTMELGVMFGMVKEKTSSTAEVPLRILHGVTDAARQHGALLHIEYVYEEAAARMASLRDVPAALRKPKVSGVLMVGALPPQVISMMAGRKPCAGLGFHAVNARMDCVGQDDRSAVEEVVKRLKALGHRKIGYYCKGLDTAFSRSRYTGYVGALALEKLPYDPKYEVIQSRPEGEGLKKLVRGVDSGIRAWICAHDGWGYEVIRHLQGSGFSVPDDVSVCGFDHVHVPDGSVGLMSVEWPLEDMGAAGIELLVRRINEPMRAISQVLFDGRVLNGQSVGPAPKI